jgi:hypothetical protein
MTRERVRAELGAIGVPFSHERRELDYLDKSNALQVEYQDGTACFIGAAQSPGFSMDIYGIDPFDTKATDLFRLLAERAAEPAQFDPVEHCFRSTIVTLYDPSTQYDRKGGGRRRIWGQIGVGDPRYLAAVDAIRAR